MIKHLKSSIRELLPKRYQVPVKYFFNRLRGHLEDEMFLLDLIIKKLDLTIDIGGNRGNYAYRLWRLGAKVEVFEPNPMCSSVLSAWAFDKANVHVHSVALSSTAGSANLHIPVDESGVEHDSSASIEHTEFEHARDQLVSLRTLDSYNFQRVNFIKIDVEGHEYSVIEGATETLLLSRPALLMEIEQRHSKRPISEVFEKMNDLGYQVFFLGPNSLASIEEFDIARDQSLDKFGGKKGRYINNFLFLHQSRLAAGEYQTLFSTQGY